jgi:hypothetical protein
MDKVSAPDNSLKPALASINDACRYMGGISRAKFYADVLPALESVRLGKRHLVLVASIDRHIAANLVAAPSKLRLGRDGVQLKDAAGKLQWSPVVSFATRELADRRSESVLAALRQSHPAALDELALPT